MPPALFVWRDLCFEIQIDKCFCERKKKIDVKLSDIFSHISPTLSPFAADVCACECVFVSVSVSVSVCVRVSE